MNHRDLVITVAAFAAAGAVGALLMIQGPGTAGAAGPLDRAPAGPAAAQASSGSAQRSHMTPGLVAGSARAAVSTPAPAPAPTPTPTPSINSATVPPSEAAAVAPARSSATRPAVRAPAGPVSRVVTGPAHQLRAEPAEVELGTVEIGASRSVTVTLTNHGPDTVEIVDVRTSCGCTAAILDDRSIAPGATASIAVAFDAERLGAQERLVRVVTSGRRGNVLTVPVRATVVASP